MQQHRRISVKYIKKKTAASTSCDGVGRAPLLPRPLRCRVGVGVDGRRCQVWVGGQGRVWVGRVRWRRVLRHDVRMTVGGSGGVGRGGGGGRGGRGRQVEVERGGGSRGGGGRRGRGDPLQHHVRVQLRVGAVEAVHGGLQQALLAPVLGWGVWGEKER